MKSIPVRRWLRTGPGRVGVGLTSAVVVAFILWGVLDATSESARGPAQTPVASLPGAVATVTLAPGSGVASLSKTIEPGTASAADDEVQVCGGAWVKSGADGRPSEEAMNAMDERATEEAVSTALMAMEASSDPRALAAARYFRAGRAGLEAEFLSKCGGDTVCAARYERSRSQGRPQRDALARLAQDSNDPQVYAWAYRACKGAPDADRGACLLVSAAQWARLDPSNAEAWLAVGDEARTRSDSSAFDDAMFHVASSEHHDSGWAVLSALMMDHVPAGDANLFGVWGMVIQAIGIDSVGATAWQNSARYCGAKEIADPNRRETCERMATMLVERSTTMIARSVGTGIGKRLGWPAERLDALARERHAEMAVQDMHAVQASADPFNCAGLRDQIDGLREVAHLGEIEALHRDVVATGKSVEQLALEAPRMRAERMDKLERQQAAASAAALASAGAASAVALPIR